MELQPEQSLTRLTQAMKDLRSPHQDRTETLKQLQGMVSRCEVELANLSHTMGKNPERTALVTTSFTPVRTELNLVREASA